LFTPSSGCRYPAHHSRDSFITPGYVSLRTNVFSVSWLIVLFKILAELDLGPSDTLVELDCGDGRWLIEAAKKTGCNCIGYGKSDELEYVQERREPTLAKSTRFME